MSVWLKTMWWGCGLTIMEAEVCRFGSYRHCSHRRDKQTHDYIKSVTGNKFFTVKNHRSIINPLIITILSGLWSIPIKRTTFRILFSPLITKVLFYQVLDTVAVPNPLLRLAFQWRFYYWGRIKGLFWRQSHSQHAAEIWRHYFAGMCIINTGL